LQKNLDIPDWFSYPEVIKELRKASPPKNQQGVTLFLTGLPSSGKSTIANALSLKLRELTDRQITMLDGDIVRHYFSQGLGFSRADRELNITRVGFIAKEVTKHRGIAICAVVAPFANARDKVREMVTEVGGFVEVYVNTPLTTCEKRDRKGLYKKARAGLIQNFTGVNDPYEAPTSPELSIDTSHMKVSDAISLIINQLKALGYM
jgi:sulfate adenylyltransferase